jgi:hypothetical protein
MKVHCTLLLDFRQEVSEFILEWLYGVQHQIESFSMGYIARFDRFFDFTNAVGSLGTL